MDQVEIESAARPRLRSESGDYRRGDQNRHHR